MIFKLSHAFVRGGRYVFTILGSWMFSVVMLFPVYAQDQMTELTAADYKKLSLEELMDIEVNLPSRKPEKLSGVASAIQVITNEEIRRSAAMRLPEALRLASNLRVSQLNSYATIVSSRGFNNVFSNKLLVMLDGRTVYSPLFAGVYWDVQNVLLEDIDKIEVVSGPGGTLWGMNAVNGVINVVTKSAEDTQGLFVSGAYGSWLNNFGGLRYGGKLGNRFSYRVYSQRYQHNAFMGADGAENADSWAITQGGFRVDGELTDRDEVMLQGNAYGGTENTLPSESTLDGQNILGRWRHKLSDNSGVAVQLFADRTWRRDIPSTFSDQLLTYDVDVQHYFAPHERHSVMWGIGYRFIRDESGTSTDFVGFVPENRNMPLYSGFVQDEIKLSEKLRLTVGSKFQHNVYSGFEVLPSGRLAYTTAGGHTLWGAVSRAVRAPSRIDRDYFIPKTPVPPGTPSVGGGPNFVSEKLLAYELGYRVQPTDFFSLSVATFYNRYTDLWSVDRVPTDTVRYQIQNNSEGYSYGAELAAIYRVSTAWRLKGGYTWFHKKLRNKPGSGSVYDVATFGFDPSHQVTLQSMLDLPYNFQADVFGRYVSAPSGTDVDAYLALDVRLAWVYRQFELSVSGRNLLKETHREFGQLGVPRNFYGSVTFRF